MVFRFQFEVSPDHWQDVGSAHGEGDGPQAVGAAIQTLIEQHEGVLPAGEYRYRPLDGSIGNWSTLTLSSTWASKTGIGPPSKLPAPPRG